MSNWRYYEGTTSAGQILKDMAKVLCTAVKDRQILDADGNEVKPAKTIPSANWDIVYPVYDNSVLSAVVDINNPTPEEFDLKIINQISKIADTVVLKTKTTAKDNQGAKSDDLGLENDLAAESIEMYLELYKPKYLADPEQYNPETERFGIMPYLVTKDIYRDYASTKGFAEISFGNLEQFESFFNETTDTKLGEVTLIPDTIAPQGGSISSYKANRIQEKTDEAYLLQYLLKKANITNSIVLYRLPVYTGNPGIVDKSTAEVVSLYPAGSSKVLKLNIRDIETDKEFPDLLEVIERTIGLGGSPNLASFKTKFEAIEFTIGFESANYGATQSASKDCDRYYVEKGDKLAFIVEGNPNTTLSAVLNFGLSTKYIQPRVMMKASDKFTLSFRNPGKIKTETMKLIAGIGAGNIQPDSVWGYNSTTGLFSLKTALGPFDLLTGGKIVLEFEYEKEQATITDKKLIFNNHYLFARIFDKYDPLLHGPVANTIDPSTGEVTVLNGHTSEWAKLSWYQDFEEILIDELDTDVGISDLSQGTVFLPIQTPGLNTDTRLRFWSNVSNNRASIVLMGNPSLDFSANRHLTSMFYVGQIESFQNSINDTAGNFALMTSSSTVPCDTQTKVNRTSTPSKKQIANIGGSLTEYSLPSLPQGQYYDEAGGFMFHTKKDGETVEIQVSTTNAVVTINPSKQSGKVKFKFDVEAGTSVYCSYSAYQEKVEQIQGIVRDTFGNILQVKYPETWGKNTATGVTDVCMLHTRSKAYFQKHHFMFTSTEEYMTKEMYGKSAYTGEYYADRIKITHGNDGPRGMLQDVLVIDQSSLVALDELIVNRNFEKDVEKPQETYVFFPINAPYSPFSGSPNAMFGLAIKKEHIEPAAKTDEEAVARTIADLYIGTLTNVMSDLFLPTEGSDGTTIAWTSSDVAIAVTNPL